MQHLLLVGNLIIPWTDEEAPRDNGTNVSDNLLAVASGKIKIASDEKQRREPLQKGHKWGAIIGPLVAGGASRHPGIAIASEMIPS